MDAPLLDRVAEGDEEAVRECVDRYGGVVWGLARRMFADAASAEDAVQEVFIHLWRTAGRYDPRRGAEGTFVGVVARRKLLELLRRDGRRRDAAADLPDLAEEPTPDAVCFAEDSAELRECWSRLTVDQQGVLSRSVFGGLSYPQIAEEIGRPLGTVKTWARSALKSLSACWHAKQTDIDYPAAKEGTP